MHIPKALEAPMTTLICTKTCSTCRKAVALLNEKGVAFQYREYTKEPLSVAELEALFEQLGVEPKALLRSRDAKKYEVSADLPADALIAKMAEFPRLLQRPILQHEGKVAVGRPVENLLTIL